MLAVFITGMALPLASVAAPSGLSEIKALYAKGSFAQCRVAIDKHLSANPNDEIGLYYKGLVHQQLHETAKAREAFIQVQAITKDAKLRQLAAQGVGANSTAAASTANSRADQAIQNIRSQSQAAQEDWARRGEEGAQAEISKGEHAAANYEHRARIQAETLRGAHNQGQRGAGVSEADLHEQARRMGDEAKQNAKSYAEVSKDIAKRHAELTAETAADLESQLRNPGQNGNVRLNPVGTNLYIRNYQHRPPVEPLRADVKVLKDPRSEDWTKGKLRTGGNAAGTAASGKLLGKPALDVHGEVIRK